MSNLLEPLVLALKWPGNYRHLIESLPHFSKNFELTDFLNVMSSINYRSEFVYQKLSNVSKKYFPCLFIPNKGPAFLLLNQQKNIIYGINGDTKELERIEDLSKSGKMYHFSQIASHNKSHRVKERQTFNDHFVRFRSLIIQIMVLTFAYNILGIAVPIYIMSLYDKVIPAESTSMLVGFSIGALLFIFSSQIINVFRSKIIAYIGSRLDKTIGEEIIHHLLYLSPAYTETNSVGNQISRIKDFDSIRDFFTGSIALTLCELPFTLIFFLIIYWLGGFLVLVPIVLAIVFAVVYAIANPIISKSIKAHAVENSVIQSFLLDSFSKLRSIKSTGKSIIWEDRFSDMLVRAAKHSLVYNLHYAFLSIISEFLMMLAALSMLAFGAIAAIKGNVSLGALIAVMMLTWKILNPMKSFFCALPKIRQIQNSISQLNRLFAIATEQDEEKTTAPVFIDPVKVEISRVTFKYNINAQPAILGLSFATKPGDLVCITGKNGAGKSTLLRLILGFYTPQAGEIKVDNMNILQFDLSEYRHSISYMPQINKLFFGTIRQNLQFSNILATDPEIEAACQMADIYDEIMELPDQYNTKITEQNSSHFSSSFVQRLVLARTYLKKAKVILLDEPDNCLDKHAEDKFLQALKVLKASATIFLVTHKISHLNISDKILLLNRGQMVLYGPSDKVLEKISKAN